MTPSPEYFPQQYEEKGKWWRYLGLGLFGAVVLIAVIDAIDLEIPRISNG